MRLFKKKMKEEIHIQFRYQPYAYENGTVQYGENTCQCCGKKVTQSIHSMYCAQAIDCLCLECVAEGKAAKKFNGSFIQDAEKIIEDKQQTTELFERTPGYESWQGEYWLTCCDDYCAYIGTVGTKELEEMGILDEVLMEYESRQEGYENIREYLTKDGSFCGYLFQCLHCNKYHLWVDAD